MVSGTIQVFVPSAGHCASGSHHVDILAQLGPMPTATEWSEKGLDKYGLIPVNEQGDASQVEKVTYETAMSLLKGFGKLAKVGPSLGSFSMTNEMMEVMLNEFAGELASKEAKMDTDPHFWMPLTLSKENYIAVMTKKGELDPDPATHWDRMVGVKTAIATKAPDKRLFGAVDVGCDGYWWDYGQLRLYVKNNLMMLGDTIEANAYKRFYKIPESGLLECKGNFKTKTVGLR